ncbi:hypothetical protein [Methylobacterium radiodurans]|uniref:hypothetical protein n=1 Tax=Methylobacterium radiodurans TaxID=2202828 RepID=UPI0013A5BAD8|nr:hypothetical protein [Methylobacterium radiodurans]
MSEDDDLPFDITSEEWEKLLAEVERRKRTEVKRDPHPSGDGSADDASRPPRTTDGDAS